MTEKMRDEVQTLKDDVMKVPSHNESAATLRAATTNTDDKGIRRIRTIATIILIILILLILAACIMLYSLLGPNRGLIGDRYDSGVTWIRSIYGHGNTHDALINPSTAVFDPDGQSIWVADPSRFRIAQYDINGRLLRIINADWRVNELIVPSAIAISPKGWHYVAEQTYNRVHIFDENWVHQSIIRIEMPLAVAANDEMLVIGSRSGFAVFSYRGDPIGMHGVDSPDEINHFDYVHGVAIDSNNNIFAIDAFGNRLVKYDAEGVPIYEVNLGHPGNQGIEGGRDIDEEELRRDFPATMQLPRGITLDANGRVYIIDKFDFSVAILDGSDGSFIRKVGIMGTADGRFFNPVHIDYNPVLDMFASSEAQLGRVQLFGIEGSAGDPLSSLRRQLNDFLNACCIPLIIILIILAAYLVSRYLSRKRREKEMTAALAGSADSDSEGVVDAVEASPVDAQEA